MNAYELVVLFDPNLGEEKIGQIISKIEAKISSLGGELEKTDKWGVKNLPGRLKSAKKLKQAYFTVIYFKGASELPGKLQGFLKVTENIIRYSTQRSQPMPAAEIEGAPQKIEAINVGEIKGAEEALGES